MAKKPLHGGSWFFGLTGAFRASYYNDLVPRHRNDDGGFRLCASGRKHSITKDPKTYLYGGSWYLFNSDAFDASYRIACGPGYRNYLHWGFRCMTLPHPKNNLLHMRGGSWGGDRVYLFRAAHRSNAQASGRSNYIGFRCAASMRQADERNPRKDL